MIDNFLQSVYNYTKLRIPTEGEPQNNFAQATYKQSLIFHELIKYLNTINEIYTEEDQKKIREVITKLDNFDIYNNETVEALKISLDEIYNRIIK